MLILYRFLTIWHCSSVPVGTRTLDPLIKSQLLYQLSYGDITVSNMLTVYEDNKFIKSYGLHRNFLTHLLLLSGK